MKIELKPIRPKRIPDQVFDQLRELIFRGDYQPGQKIMTERELAEALNVSRNSVREAINKLVTLRLVEQRHRGVDLLQGLGFGDGLVHGVAFLGEDLADVVVDGHLVVDNQYSRQFGSGHEILTSQKE